MFASAFPYFEADAELGVITHWLSNMDPRDASASKKYILLCKEEDCWANSFDDLITRLTHWQFLGKTTLFHQDVEIYYIALYMIQIHFRIRDYYHLRCLLSWLLLLKFIVDVVSSFYMREAEENIHIWLKLECCQTELFSGAQENIIVKASILAWTWSKEWQHNSTIWKDRLVNIGFYMYWIYFHPCC